MDGARRYSELQLRHAALEDDVLLPLVAELLDEPAGARVLRGFDALEAGLRRPAAEHARRLERIAARLDSVTAGPAGPAAPRSPAGGPGDR